MSYVLELMDAFTRACLYIAFLLFL